MSFFQRLFGRKTDEKDAGPTPTRALKLQYPVTPENGQRFAQQFVESIKKIDGVDLDYSVASLALVDEFLQRFSDEGLTVNDFAETIFVAGCYLGEVMVMNANGEWASGQGTELPPVLNPISIFIKLPDGKFVDPIAKAYKRFHFGESDQIEYFYEVFTRK